MKLNGYRKSLMKDDEENANTITYDAGYDQGQKDLFVPIIVIGTVCAVVGGILALVML